MNGGCDKEATGFCVELVENPAILEIVVKNKWKEWKKSLSNPQRQTWMFLALTWQKADGKRVVNWYIQTKEGTLAMEQAQPGTARQTPVNNSRAHLFIIGSNSYKNNAGKQATKVDIDHIRMYYKALNQQQVYAMYHEYK